MELRTTFNIPPAEKKISYHKPVIFIGSCFASMIGRKFEAGRLPVVINPSGTVYNPFSVSNTIHTITEGINCTEKDLYNYDGLWISFNHHTGFVSDDPSYLINKINKNTSRAKNIISTASHLFVTFGTARVYRFRETGKIVSNCHKLPALLFTHELLETENILSIWNEQLDKLKILYPDMKVVFTISPVRHWKDGAHGNQVSKSVLFLAVEKLLQHPSQPAYFPSYELVMDDLRDYRFYADDMLHLSSVAEEYVWDAFTDCYLDGETRDLYREIFKITQAVSHHIRTDSRLEIKNFAKTMLHKIESVSSRMPGLDLDAEKKYFTDLL